MNRNRFKNRLLSSGNFLLWSIVFGVSYTQFPLYHSNQNQYFLHGLANGGMGLLSEDWLANTVDPSPVFSFLVFITYRYLHPYLFHFYHLILAGVYMFSMINLVCNVCNIKEKRAKYVVYLLGFVAIHSKAFDYVSAMITGTRLGWELQSGVAAQHILGTEFEPSAFGIFLILSVATFLRGRPFWAVSILALTVTFHSTYLFSAAILTLSYMIITFDQEKTLKKPLSIGLLSLILVTPVLTYTYLNFAPSASDVAIRSREILVNHLSYHTLPKTWFGPTSVAKIALVVATLYVIRKTQVFRLMLIPFMAAVVFGIAQVISGSDLLALIFPWRLSVFLVPMSTSIILAHLISVIFTRFRDFSLRIEKPLTLISFVVILALFIGGVAVMSVRTTRHRNYDSAPMMNYVKEHASAGEQYLIPVRFITFGNDLEGFRLYTGAPILVDFKSIPYKDSDVMEWYERLYEGYTFYESGDCQLLNTLAIEYGITHVVLETLKERTECDLLFELYRDNLYGVYRLDFREGLPS